MEYLSANDIDLSEYVKIDPKESQIPTITDRDAEKVSRGFIKWSRTPWLRRRHS